MSKQLKQVKEVVARNDSKLAQAVLDYVSLKEQAAALESRMRDLREPIEKAVAKSQGQLDVAGFTLTLSECSRESFNLKAARCTVPAHILAPFVSKSSYTRLVIR
jgi:hypothetical protein